MCTHVRVCTCVHMSTHMHTKKQPELLCILEIWLIVSPRRQTSQYGEENQSLLDAWTL